MRSENRWERGGAEQWRNRIDRMSGEVALVFAKAKELLR